MRLLSVSRSAAALCWATVWAVLLSVQPHPRQPGGHTIPRCELLNFRALPHPEGCYIDKPNGIHGYRRRKSALIETGIGNGGQAWASGDKSGRCM